MYNSGRYFTVTGRHLSGTPSAIHDRQELVTDLQRELFVQFMSSSRPKIPNAFSLSDEELIERARNTHNGDRFRRLWAGDASDYGNDHSRADLALCRALVFWCGGDMEQVDRLFRRSGLMREKWDRKTGDAFTEIELSGPRFRVFDSCFRAANDTDISDVCSQTVRTPGASISTRLSSIPHRVDSPTISASSREWRSRT